MIYYKDWRLPSIGGKPRWVIVDETGNIVNRNPRKDELNNLEKEKYKIKRKNINYVKYTDDELLKCLKQFYEENGRIPMQTDFANNPNYPHFSTYRIRFGSWNGALDIVGLLKKCHNETNTCDRCGKSFDKLGWTHPMREYDIEGKWTGRWDCTNCHEKYDPNSTTNTIKSMTNCRTGYQNSECSTAEGDQTIELVCKLYGYIDLNKKYDKYNTEIDCQDPETGLFYQIKGKLYNPTYRRWDFAHLEREWYKRYEDIILICKNKYGNGIEQIYRIPFKEIYDLGTEEGRTSISIYKNPTVGRYSTPSTPWYEQYRIKDDEEIKKANDILKKDLD